VLLAALGAGLNRWAFHRPVGAKNAAIARLWLEQNFAVLAFVKPLTGVSRHLFNNRISATGTRDQRFDLDGGVRYGHNFVSDCTVARRNECRLLPCYANA
jgi:hypothetical protein